MKSQCFKNIWTPTHTYINISWNKNYADVERIPNNSYHRCHCQQMNEYSELHAPAIEETYCILHKFLFIFTAFVYVLSIFNEIESN